MSVKLLITVGICLGLSGTLSQTTPSCPVKIYTTELADALRDLQKGQFAEPTATGMDALFAALRSGKETELVILLDNSLEVRPNHFYLVTKTLVEHLLKYHVPKSMVSVSVIAFGEDNVTVLCKEVSGSCSGVKQCMDKAAYASNHTSGWIGSTLIKAMNETKTIFSQPSKANKQKIALVVSGFQITSFFMQQIMVAKQNLTAAGATIYTVLSSFRGRVAEATQIASSADKYMADAAFVTKVFNIIPLGDRSCAGITTPALNENSLICKGSQGGKDMCMCKLGYDGPKCETTPNYCSYTSACPLGSTCSLRGDYQYTCFCPECNSLMLCLNFLPQNQTGGPSPGQPPMVPPPGNQAPSPGNPTPPRDRVPAPTPPRDRVAGPTPPQDRVPTPTPPRDRVPEPTPPRDRAPQDIQPLPNQPAIPPTNTLLAYIKALLDRAQACIYPPGTNEIQG